MNNNYNNNIDFSKLNESIDTISSLDSCLKMTDLSSYILDIESIIKNINFEHNNFITNYKNEISNIIEDIELVKKEVGKLSNALSRTMSDYAKGSYSDNDIKDLSTIYENTDFSNIKDNIINFRENILTDMKHLATSDNITKIPPVQENSTVNQNIQENQPYNTIPIGLGIAATGISASVGAVLVNENEHKKDKNQDINFEEMPTNNNEVIENDDNDDNVLTKVVPEAVYESYRASRRSEDSKNIFYSDENDEYFKDE